MKFNDRFAQFVLNQSLLDKETVTEALRISELNQTPLFETLVKSEFLTTRVVYESLAQYLKIPYKFYQISELDLELFKSLPRDKILEYHIVPIEQSDDSITFAFSNPFKYEELQEFSFFVNKKIVPVMVEPEQLELLVRYADNKLQQDSAIKDFSDSSAISTNDEENQLRGTNLIDAPIIKLCDSILSDAVNRGASDIHIEPFENQVVIRFRIDGKLSVIDRMVVGYFPSMLARFKIMSGMNIAERRIPQDGKINKTLGNSKYDFRVSTIPTIFGEKIVIRIYDVGLSNSSLKNLGFDHDQEQLILEMIHRPHGIILMTGPTGSGKSTSLYTFLRYLNKEDTNIITVEDPVENQIDGVNQVQVNAKATLTFASALRSILRQDPNVIMIGEIRDEETAQIATRAAITGHLVLSTIHTNDAAGVVSRLINMGIPNYLVADALLGAISQRLVRRLCPVCKKAHITTEAEMKILGLNSAKRIYKPVGCPACNNTGYNGRVGVFEILVCDDVVKATILDPLFTSDKLNKVAKIKSLLDDAKQRVLNGDTSIEEYQDLNEVIVRRG